RGAISEQSERNARAAGEILKRRNPREVYLGLSVSIAGRGGISYWAGHVIAGCRKPIKTVLPLECVWAGDRSSEVKVKRAKCNFVARGRINDELKVILV